MTIKSEDNKDSFDILGIPVSTTNLTKAINKIIKWSGDTKGRFVCIRDVHGIIRSIDDKKLMKLHQDASMITPDGIPLVILGKLAGKKIDRTCGPDLFGELIKKGITKNIRHYFYKKYFPSFLNLIGKQYPILARKILMGRPLILRDL